MKTHKIIISKERNHGKEDEQVNCFSVLRILCRRLRNLFRKNKRVQCRCEDESREEPYKNDESVMTRDEMEMSSTERPRKENGQSQKIFGIQIKRSTYWKMQELQISHLHLMPHPCRVPCLLEVKERRPLCLCLPWPSCYRTLASLNLPSGSSDEGPYVCRFREPLCVALPNHLHGVKVSLKDPFGTLFTFNVNLDDLEASKCPSRDSMGELYYRVAPLESRDACPVAERDHLYHKEDIRSSCSDDPVTCGGQNNDPPGQDGDQSRKAVKQTARRRRRHRARNSNRQRAHNNYR